MKMTAKRTLCFLLTLLVLSAVCLFPAEKAEAQCASYNPRYASLVSYVDAANAKISFLICLAQLTPWNDVPLLVPATERIAADTMAYAARIGLPGRVICVYETYRIDGQTVEIDPLKVINY